MRKILTLLTVLMLGIFTAHAQSRTITGKVTDSTNQPIAGASILLKGTSRGTTSGSNGLFSLSARTGDVLVISGVGFKPEQLTVGEGNDYVINMSATTSTLSEVVVTALGLSRNRNTLPYAAQQISGDELNKAGPTVNAVSSLAGKVAGLQITQQSTMGGSTNVILRGIKSLTQSNQALFVVDGVPYDNTGQSQQSYDLGNAASDLNPDDIESISVLKGAAASALYGSRASNGVILITTKKGRARSNLGVSATFGVTAGSPDRSTLPTYQTEYGQGYGSAGNSPAQPNASEGFFYNATPSFNPNTKVLVPQTNNDAATGPAYDPSLMVYNWDAFTPGDPNYGKATPWKPAANHNPTDYFVTPVITSASVYVNNASDKGNYKIGYTRDWDKDFMPNSHLNKNLISFSADYKIVNKVTIGANIDYSDNAATNRYLYPYTGGSSPMTDFRQWWPTNVDISQQKADYFKTGTNASWNWQTGAYKNNVLGNIGLPAYHDNLYWFAYQNPENDSRTRYFGNAHLNYTITPYLSALLRVSKDYYDQMLETRNDVGSQTVPYYFRYNSNYNEMNYDALLNFDKNLSNSFNLKALVGTNIRQSTNQYIWSQTNGGLVVPGFFALSNSKKTPNAPTEYYGKREVDGVFAGATLSYKELLTLDGTIRRDQSSTLPKNNNTYYYPSVSLNFQFAKLLPNMKWLTHGKVWGNYAEVGGDAPVFSVYNTYNSQTPFNGQTLFSAPTVNNNASLLPEKQKSWETGMEASFLNDRIGFSADYYHSQQINQITPTSVSTATGFNTFYVNGGAIQNTGVEVSINITPIRTRNFSWDLRVNWSTNQQKILSLYNNQPQYAVATYQNALRLEAEPGKPYQLQGTDYVYKNGQRVIDGSGYYEIAPNKFTDLGTPNADWIGGINNTLRYKNLSLSFLIDTRKGGKVYSLDMDYGSSSGLYPRTAGKNDLGNPVRSPLTTDNKSGGIILKGVTEDGKPNTVRIDESDINAGAYTFSSAYGEADREFVYDASYIKLRELSLNYSIPGNAFRRATFIKGINVSIVGRNLWIIHKNLPYSDPEQGQASGNASIGFQNGAYPTIRTMGAVVKFNF